MIKLKKQALPVLLVDLRQHERLQAMADKQSMTLADFLTSHVLGLLDSEQVTLNVPRKLYDVFVRFFDNDEEHARGSMVGHLELGAADFIRVMKSLGE